MISTQQDSRGAIRLDGVAKSFGSTQALSDVTLSAPAGTFLILLAPRAAANPRCCG